MSKWSENLIPKLAPREEGGNKYVRATVSDGIIIGYNSSFSLYYLYLEFI